MRYSMVPNEATGMWGSGWNEMPVKLTRRHEAREECLEAPHGKIQVYAVE